MADHGGDVARLRELITGYEPAQCVYVAAKLGVADALGDRPRTVAELARAIGADGDALGRLMRGLASLGIVVARDAGANAYELTPLGRQLRTDAPGSLRAPAPLAGERSYRVWGALAGRERTRAEYERLLRRAGLSLERVIPTAAAESVIEARPAGR